MIRPTLIVMAKTPRIGHGKQRLARDVGRVEAWRINRFLLTRAMNVSRDPRWDAVLAVTPDRDAKGGAIPQGRGDLGARLSNVFTGRNVAVIGTDCPQIRKPLIWSTFRALRRSPFVIGPSLDGGFWIFAARDARQVGDAFSRVRWSTQHACDDLVGALGARGEEIRTLRDVDTGADWRAYQRSKRT